MEKDEMIATLEERARKIAEELKALELQFNIKKEEFLKLQGALEALRELTDWMPPALFLWNIYKT